MTILQSNERNTIMGKTKKGKEKVAAKMAKAKAKIARKAKGMCACIAAFALAFVCGCMTPEQASRSTNATYGDMEAKVATDIGEKAHNNAVTVDIKVTIGDGAIASADSSGSTESQTQTPTFDISPKTDLRYNDATRRTARRPLSRARMGNAPPARIAATPRSRVFDSSGGSLSSPVGAGTP